MHSFPTDSLPVLIVGIVLLIVTAMFVVGFLVLSKLRKKVKSTPRYVNSRYNSIEIIINLMFAVKLTIQIRYIIIIILL